MNVSLSMHESSPLVFFTKDNEATFVNIVSELIKWKKHLIFYKPTQDADIMSLTLTLLSFVKANYKWSDRRCSQPDKAKCCQTVWWMYQTYKLNNKEFTSTTYCHHHFPWVCRFIRLCTHCTNGSCIWWVLTTLHFEMLNKIFLDFCLISLFSHSQAVDPDREHTSQAML